MNSVIEVMSGILQFQLTKISFENLQLVKSLALITTPNEQLYHLPRLAWIAKRAKVAAQVPACQPGPCETSGKDGVRSKI